MYRLSLGLLLLCSAAVSVERWLKLKDFWGDSSRWIFEAYRSANGELLYRDFAWQYAPLPLLLFGKALALFGSTFAVAQTLLDILGAAIIVLTWQVARRILPEPLALAVAFTLLAAGAGNTGNFALFSLRVYTPAILVGMAGLLLALLPVLDYLSTGLWTGIGLACVTAGSTIALLSKPEYIVGTLGVLCALATVDRGLWSARLSFGSWLGRYAGLFALAIVPSLVFYGLLARLTGRSTLLEGVGGYGMAYLSCPWWPTGLGMFGGLVALLQAGAMLAFFSVIDAARFRQSYPRAYWLAWCAVPLAVLASAIYLPYCIAEMPVFQGGSGLVNAISFYLSTGSILLPVMWSAIVLGVVLTLRCGRALFEGRPVKLEQATLLVLIVPAILMSMRSLFGGTMSQLTTASVAAYPLWFVVGLYCLLLIHGRISAGSSQSLAVVSLTVLVFGYGVLRLTTAIMLDHKASYSDLITRAGRVKLLDPEDTREVYRYVEQHSGPRDTILDTSYGGAVNFAARRRSPIFSTQFSALAPSDSVIQLDLRRIQQAPPKLVIMSTEPNFGASYGICMPTACPFPAIVWHSTQPACDATRSFPVLEFIVAHYAPVVSLGTKTIYGPKQGEFAQVIKQ